MSQEFFITEGDNFIYISKLESHLLIQTVNLVYFHGKCVHLNFRAQFLHLSVETQPSNLKNENIPFFFSSYKGYISNFLQQSHKSTFFNIYTFFFATKIVIFKFAPSTLCYLLFLQCLWNWQRPWHVRHSCAFPSFLWALLSECLLGSPRLFVYYSTNVQGIGCRCSFLFYEE